MDVGGECDGSPRFHDKYKMETTYLICANCNKEFVKDAKEYRRRIKVKPNTRFYCGRKCTGIDNSGNLNITGWNASDENKTHLRSIGAKANSRYSVEEKPFGEYARRARNRKHHAGFDLTVPYLMEIWNAQHGKCALSRIPLLHRHQTDNANDMASLDRIDSSKGYIQGNVQFISCALNWAKSNRTDDSILDLLAKIAKYSKI